MDKWARFRLASRNRVIYRTLLFLFIIPACRAVLVNRTIDSNKEDPATGFVPIYQPQLESPWADQTCSGCFIQPDIAKAYDGTWNAATYHPQLRNVNITLRFTGVAVWVFFILSNANSNSPGTTTNTQVNITLDGQYAGNFSHDPDMSTQDLIYNATIFSTTGLANTSHELVIATNDYPNSTFLNFDWATYTADVDAPASQSASLSTMTVFSSTTDSSSTSSTSSPTSTPQHPPSKTGVIVGSTVGVLVVIALVLTFLVRRSRRRPPPARHENVEGALNIDVPPYQSHGRPQTHQHDPPAPSASKYKRFPPSSSSTTQSPARNYAPERRKTTILREARQMNIHRRIQSAQREMDNLMKSVRNARSAGEIGNPSAPGQRQRMQELASLRNELQQLRDQIGSLQAQREADRAPGLANELPPVYTCH